MTTRKEILREENIALSAMHALIGAITPNIRVVSLKWSEKVIDLNFIFDGEISIADKEEAELVRKKMQLDFPADSVRLIYRRIDFPQQWEADKFGVYMRRKEMKYDSL